MVRIWDFADNSTMQYPAYWTRHFVCSRPSHLLQAIVHATAANLLWKRLQLQLQSRRVRQLREHNRRSHPERSLHEFSETNCRRCNCFVLLKRPLCVFRTFRCIRDTVFWHNVLYYVIFSNISWNKCNRDWWLCNPNICARRRYARYVAMYEFPVVKMFCRMVYRNHLLWTIKLPSCLLRPLEALTMSERE